MEDAMSLIAALPIRRVESKLSIHFRVSGFGGCI